MRCSRLRLTDRRSSSSRLDPSETSPSMKRWVHELQAFGTGIPSAELLRRVKAYRAAVRWKSGRTAALVWLQATGPQGIALDSASLLEAAAGESAATETAARPGAPARLALAAAGLSDPVDARKIRRISWTVFATVTAPPWTARLAAIASGLPRRPFRSRPVPHEY